MKKVIAVAAIVLAGASSAFAESSSIAKASLYDQIAAPKVDTVKGLELGLVYSNTPAIRGLQLNVIANKTEDLKGAQVAFAMNSAKSATGVQYGIYNTTKELKGVQLGIVNSAEKAAGVQYSVYNTTKEMDGVQLGLVNYAEKFSGFQFALVNYTVTMGKGLQIGVVNFIKNSKLPTMVIANAKF